METIVYSLYGTAQINDSNIRAYSLSTYMTLLSMKGVEDTNPEPTASMDQRVKGSCWNRKP